MLDLNFFRTDPDRIRQDLKKRHLDGKRVDEVIKLDAKNRGLLRVIELCRYSKHSHSEAIAKLEGAEKEKVIKEMKEYSKEEKHTLVEQEAIEEELQSLLLTFPNLTHSSTPEGPDESGNVVESTHGQPKRFDFTPKDHVELGIALGILNLEDATRMSGTRFAYLMGQGALLEFALVQFVLHKLVAKGFTPIVPPVLVKEHAMIATGFFPADKSEIYRVNAGTDEKAAGANGTANMDANAKTPQDDLFLVGTSEVPLTMLHADKILDANQLPLRYVAFSTCFRREAGSYGKDTQGIIRVHQFDKLEMFSFCHPDKSWEEHELLRSIEEEIMQELGFAYQVVNICSGDLGTPASKKYDLEAWIPTQNKYRELTSCSNCTDYQARRARIRYKTAEGKNEFVHTLNGTACAIGRTLVAILENNQNADGSIEIPHVLQPYMNGVTQIRLT